MSDYTKMESLNLELTETECQERAVLELAAEVGTSFPKPSQLLQSNSPRDPAVAFAAAAVDHCWCSLESAAAQFP